MLPPDFILTDGRLLGESESTDAKQALSSACRGKHVLHRAAEVPHIRSIGRSLPKSTNLYKQTGRKTVSGSVTSQS